MAVSSQVGGSSAVGKKYRLGVLLVHGIDEQQGSTLQKREAAPIGWAQPPTDGPAAARWNPTGRNGTVAGQSHKGVDDAGLSAILRFVCDDRTAGGAPCRSTRTRSTI
jgi:hypothetical protein